MLFDRPGASEVGEEALSVLRGYHAVVRRVHAGSEDPHALLEEIAACVVEFTGFQHVVVNVRRGDFLDVELMVGPPEMKTALGGQRTTLGAFERDFAHAHRAGLLRFIPDEESRPWEDMPTFLPDYEVRDDVEDPWLPGDALVARLEGPDGELTGVLSVDVPRDRRRPSLARLRLLEMFADQAGLALHHARERDRMAGQARLARLAHETLRTSAELDLDTLSSRAATVLTEGLGGAMGCLRIFEVDGAPGSEQWCHIEPVVVDGCRPPTPREAGQLRRLAERDFMRGEVAVLDQHPDGRWLPVTWDRPRPGLGSVLVVPVGVADCLGYLLVMRRSRPWSRTEHAWAAGLGSDLGRAVANARIHQREGEVIERLELLDATRRRMISTVSHEMKNPLTAIAAHLEMLEDDTDDASREALHLVPLQRATGRLSRLVEEFLDVLRSEDETLSLEETLDLRAVVAGELEVVAGTAGRSGVGLHHDLGGDAVIVRGNAHGLGRAVANLAGNAVKYTPRGGRVDVRLRAAGDLAELEVRDTGIGMSESDLERMYDAYFRSDDVRTRGLAGTGLGLGIVRRVVEQHGGSIVCDSRPGEGSTFVVRLPLAVAP